MSNSQYYITIFHHLYRSSGVVRTVRLGRPWWDGDVARLRETRNNTEGWWRKILEKMAEDCKEDGRITLKWILGERNIDDGRWMQLVQDLMSSDEFLVLMVDLYATHM
jgi:hypothetical protein